VDWNKLRAEYIAGGISYRKLAEKYGVSFSTLRDIAIREKWTGLKSQAQNKSVTKLVESVAKQNGTYTVSVIDVADKLLNKIETMIDAEGLTISNIKDLSSSLKNLKEIKGIKSDIDLKEQKARIKKLEKEIEANNPNGDKPYGVVLMPPIMADLTPPKEEDDG
jgi:uncharacterized protein YjcR